MNPLIASTAEAEAMEINIDQLNEDIKHFPQVHPITPDMHRALKGVSRLVMLDRYSFKDIEKRTLKKGDFVVLTIKEDPKFPARGYGFVLELDRVHGTAVVCVDESFRSVLDHPEEQETGIIRVSLDVWKNRWKFIMNKLPNASLPAWPRWRRIQLNGKKHSGIFIMNSSR